MLYIRCANLVNHFAFYRDYQIKMIIVILYDAKMLAESDVLLRTFKTQVRNRKGRPKREKDERTSFPIPSPSHFARERSVTRPDNWEAVAPRDNGARCLRQRMSVYYDVVAFFIEQLQQTAK